MPGVPAFTTSVNPAAEQLPCNHTMHPPLSCNLPVAMLSLTTCCPGCCTSSAMVCYEQAQAIHNMVQVSRDYQSSDAVANQQHISGD